MSSDDLTKQLPDDKGKTTQPMIQDVFNLVEELKRSMETRLDSIDAHLDSTNARLDSIDAHLDSTNARLDSTNARLDSTNARLDSTNARLDEVELRLARDIEGVNTRVTEGFRELAHKISALNRRSLQTEANYESLSDRVDELESKAS